MGTTGEDVQLVSRGVELLKSRDKGELVADRRPSVSRSSKLQFTQD